MSAFDVPGWTIQNVPVREGTNRVSKKRKRPSSSVQPKSAAVNIDNLMEKLTSVLPEDNSATPPAKKRQEKQKQGPKSKEKKSASTANGPPQKKAKVSSQDSQPQDAFKSNKKAKTKITAGESPVVASSSKLVSAHATPPQASLSGLTALQKSMKEKLDGAQFRLINENLYKTDSHEAHSMMRENPKIYEEYHTGFRHQVLSWPTNPVEHYVSTFAQYPPKTIVADLGCGDAAIAKGLNDKGVAILSYDLVSDNKYVIEADICDKIPLPGSEPAGQGKSTGEGQVVDVVVCSLSLMGVNWPNCIRHAWRILKSGGELHIAEVTSRFTDIEQFQNLLGSIGFKLKSKDDTKSSHFVLFEFTKVARSDKTEKEWTKLLSRGSLLKPCEYKRR